jgi:hypothetical protein
MAAPSSAVTSLGLVDASAKAPSRRRSVLAANASLCDLYILGTDHALRMYNPRASGSLRCVQHLQPQLLDEIFLRQWPAFWNQPPAEQARLVREHYRKNDLDLPYEVVEMRLHEGSGLLALVGVNRVSILVLPPSVSVDVRSDATDELGSMLRQLGLGEYGTALRANGYEHVPTLLRMRPEEREVMTRQVSMLPGHAQTLMMHLDGRLPAAPPPPDAEPRESHGAPCWVMPIVLPPAVPAAVADGSDALRPAGPIAMVAPGHPSPRPTALTTPAKSPALAEATQSPSRSEWRPSALAFRAPTPGGSSLPAQKLDSGRRTTPTWPLPAGATPARVVQVEWHPLGEHHLGLLLDDGTFHLIDVASGSDKPWMTFQLPCGSAGASSAYRGASQTSVARERGGIAAADTAAPAGFSFGGPSQPGWESLCIHFATASGDVYTACPVLVTGTRAQRHFAALLPQLEASLEGLESRAANCARDWLKMPNPEICDRPVLQGPFRAAPAQAPNGASPSRVIALCCISLAGGLTGVMLGRDDHRVSVCLLLESARPTWGFAWADTTEEAGAASPSEQGACSPAPASDRLQPETSWPTQATRASISARASLGGRPSLGAVRSPYKPPRQSTPTRGGGGGGSASAGGGTRVVLGAEDESESLHGETLLELSCALLNNGCDGDADIVERLEWMQLTADGFASSRLFVHTSRGTLHLLELPWLHDWALSLRTSTDDADASSPASLPAVPPRHCPALLLMGGMVDASAPPTASIKAPSQQRPLPQRRPAGVVGMATLRDPAIGDAAFAMTSDGRCSRVQLEMVHRPPVTEGASSSTATSTTAAPSGAVAAAAEPSRHGHARQRLVHHQSPPAPAEENIDWQRRKAALAGSEGADVLPAFENMVDELLGPKSTLRWLRELAEETAARMKLVEQHSAEQPKAEEKLNADLADASVELEMMGHKLRLAVALQDNLETRAKALRGVLRTPALWPCGDVSAEERQQHRQLLELRDRISEGERRRQQLVDLVDTAPGEDGDQHGAAAADEPTAAAAAAAAAPRAPPSPNVLGFTEDDLFIDDEPMSEGTAELMQQGATLERLVGELKRAKQEGREAVRLAQSVQAVPPSPSRVSPTQSFGAATLSPTPLRPGQAQVQEKPSLPKERAAAAVSGSARAEIAA